MKRAHSTHYPFVLAVYLPSPSFPIGTCTPSPPAAHVFSATAANAITPSPAIERAVRREAAVMNFTVGSLFFVFHTRYGLFVSLFLVGASLGGSLTLMT